jgi:hypothetical protein
MARATSDGVPWLARPPLRAAEGPACTAPPRRLAACAAAAACAAPRWPASTTRSLRPPRGNEGSPGMVGSSGRFCGRWGRSAWPGATAVSGHTSVWPLGTWSGHERRICCQRPVCLSLLMRICPPSVLWVGTGCTAAAEYHGDSPCVPLRTPALFGRTGSASRRVTTQLPVLCAAFNMASEWSSVRKDYRHVQFSGLGKCSDEGTGTLNHLHDGIRKRIDCRHLQNHRHDDQYMKNKIGMCASISSLTNFRQEANTNRTMPLYSIMHRHN